jgi:hypothetical protein
MNKKQLTEKYNISLVTLNKLLNKDFYNELSILGYKKKDRLLGPKVIRRFLELYGEPFNENEFN